VLVALQTAIAQVTYAFGPGVVGVLRDLSGSYTLPFYGCIALELTAGGGDHDPGTCPAVIASVAKQSRLRVVLWIASSPRSSQ